MYKKILSMILILGMSIGMAANTNVYAAELQASTEEIMTVVEIVEGDETVPEESEIEIPQNGSEVYIEGEEAQPAAFSLSPANSGTSKKRYTVLVLDTSSAVEFGPEDATIYRAEAPLPYVQKASKKFIEDLSGESGVNYVAIVSFNTGTSQVVSQFTKDKSTLLRAVDSLKAYGDHDIHRALTAAEQLLDDVPQDAIKNVVLFTTGMVGAGEYNYTGHYNASTVGSNWLDNGSGIHLYAYANAAYEAAEKLKEKCTVYSIGLFQVLEDMPEAGRNVAKFFKLLTCDLASSKNHFYDIKDPEELEFVFGQVADSIIRCTGEFSYPGKSKDYTARYYYDDNYFKESSYTYNQHLATMSLCLDLSSWNSADEPDYTRKMKNAEALLNEMGFIGFDHNYADFAEEGILGKPTKDSVGAVAAHKSVNFDGREYTLIALAIRGGGYEREWASNFTIGESGDHQGFSEARDTVIAFLKKYIAEQGIQGDIKLWITGYSRAATTANLVAGAIDKGTVDLDGCNLELKDMFAYTFETPAGTVDSEARTEKYSNIFNIVNLNDPVPKVAPEDWGFDRYGKDRFIPAPEIDGEDSYKTSKAVMLKNYQQMGGYKGYEVDDFQMKKVEIQKIQLPGVAIGNRVYNICISEDVENIQSQHIFLQGYVTLLAKQYFKSRGNYVANYQSGIRDACGIYFGTDPAKTEKLLKAIEEKFHNNWGWIIWEYVSNMCDKDAAYKKIAQYLKECLDEAEITNYSQNDFDASVTAILDLIVEVAGNKTNLAITLVYNISGIGQAHEPELCLAWMQSMDSNYTPLARPSFSTGKYRIIRVNCPVDVAVYDKEGNLLASILDDTPQPDGQVVVALNSNGEKLVYLPVHYNYVLKLTATGDGVMNYAVQEYDPYAGEANHMVLFNDIEITEGQEYTAYLPSYSEEDMESVTGTAAETDYTLFLGADPILVSEELTGEEVFNAYYVVSAAADNEERGIVLGSGMCQYGTFAKVTATAYDGYEFAGWYEGENLVSVEEEYRFRVSKEIELTAVFKESSQTPEPNPEEDPEKKPEETPNEGGDKDTEDGRRGNISGTFKVTAHWNTGFNGEIALTNTTEEAIHNWVVAFDLPYEIENIWNGRIVSYKDGVYTIQNAGYNGDIEPGKSVTFGIYVNTETENITEPAYYTLVEGQ
ncbi:MAG: cellulose binding domain-containing protein [Lachnoclostridium sp.]|nr:cellulose binding domain-containing protein [Lachnospira sp.]MCM1248495.1 cellulose binding domain-containing protein [Lachnoclostridium sp.]MCM1536128.1 cellulose binding domain-containing protein [Clostridium sp.]